MNTTDLFLKLNKLKEQKKGAKSYLLKNGYRSTEADKVAELFKTAKSEREFETQLDNLLSSVIDDEHDWSDNLKFTEKYVYNKEDDKYVFYLKAANDFVVIPGTTVRGIFDNYSNWYKKPSSVNEICRNYRIPKTYFFELREILEINHNSEPVTKEELTSKNVDQLTDDILEKKKFQLYQKLQKKSWRDTEQAAARWYDFVEGTFNPFENLLTAWVPPKYVPVKQIKSTKKLTDRAIVIGLSDIHFGTYANPEGSFRNKGANTEDIIKSIEQYCEDIFEMIDSRTYGFDECVITSLGDILHTTGQGTTTKGTPLSYDCLKEEQFNAAFDTLTKFIERMLEAFPKVKVKSVKGNHNDFGDYVLFRALQAYFRKEKRICFEVFQSEHGLFKIKNTLFVISHGSSAEYKGHIPTTGKARESYIANLFLANPEALMNVKSKVLLTADQHHWEAKEYAEFEHYMLSTIVDGDKYAEAMGLNSRAKQSCFVIDNDGVAEIIYSYPKK
jgi:hypothetical protein